MRLFYMLLIAFSGAYLFAQTIAWAFFGVTFFPDTGQLFETAEDKTLLQTIFPKNMLRLIITIFAAAVLGLLMDIFIPEGWLTLPLAAIFGIFINFLISVFFAPRYLKMHKSGEPTDAELEEMTGRVSETITQETYGVISVRHGRKGYLFRAVSANGRLIPKGRTVVILHAQDGCCFVESEEHLCDILFEEDEE